MPGIVCEGSTSPPQGKRPLSKPKLHLGSRLVRIRVERDLALCELLNGDVGSLDPNFGKQILCKSVHILYLLSYSCSCSPFGNSRPIYLLVSSWLQVIRGKSIEHR